MVQNIKSKGGYIKLGLIDIEEKYSDYKILHRVTIELLNHCNFNCIHCMLDNKKILMDRYKIFEIIDEAKQLGAFQLRLTGGEITLRDDLPEIIEYARKKYLDVILLSNMSRLSPALYECIKKYSVTQLGHFIVKLIVLVEEVRDEVYLYI